MAAADFPPQRLVSDAPQRQSNSSRFYLHFLYKVVSVAIVLVIIPLFPSQAPEFVNQTILTRGWELLHLLFVGIAVSYGLFSRRSVEIETQKEHQFIKSDTTDQIDFPKILQVSSVFDDEVECPFASDNRIQTWSSQYFRAESDVFHEESNASSYASYKPLFLPVRSLKSPVSDQESVGSVGSLSRSASDSRISSSNSSGGSGRREIGDLSPLNLEEELKENVVLPSPIPWRSRSGRMEMREEVVSVTSPFYSPPPSLKEPDFDQLKSQSFHSPIHQSPSPRRLSPNSHSLSLKEPDFDQLKSRSFRTPIHQSSSPRRLSPNSHSLSLKEPDFDQLKSRSFRTPIHQSPSPRRLSPNSHSLLPELQAKNVEELGKKNASCKCSPPPTTPLPNPESPKSSTFELHSNSSMNVFSSEKKHGKRDLKDKTRESSRRRKDELRNRRNLRMDSLKLESKPRTHVEGPSIGKSVRTFRTSESVSREWNSREIDDLMDGKTGRISDEDDTILMEEEMGIKKGGSDQLPASHEKQKCEMSNGKLNSEIGQPALKPKSSYQKREKKKLARKVILETQEYSSSDNENVQQSSVTEETVSESDAGQHLSEVDKKADEFIAKFREQIRLQRIDSIKRSSRHGTTSNS